MPPNVFVGHNAGDFLPAADWNSNWSLVESSIEDLGSFLVSGLVISAGTGLSVNVTAGAALIGAHVAVAGSITIGGLTNGAVNYLFLQQNGAGTANTSGTPPANTAFLGTAGTAGGVVTSVTPAPQGRKPALATKTAAYQMSVFDYCILANATGGSFTVGLPSAAGIAGQSFAVKKIDTSGNTVTVAAAGGESVDNAASVTLASPYTALTFISDGANFWLV